MLQHNKRLELESSECDKIVQREGDVNADLGEIERGFIMAKDKLTVKFNQKKKKVN